MREVPRDRDVRHGDMTGVSIRTVRDAHAISTTRDAGRVLLAWSGSGESLRATPPLCIGEGGTVGVHEWVAVAVEVFWAFVVVSMFVAVRVARRHRMERSPTSNVAHPQRSRT